MQAPFKSLLWFVLLALLLAVLLAGAPARAESKIKVLGAFSGVKHTHGDAFGHVVKLWQEGDQIFGLFSVYTGTAFDPPTGIIEEVKYDPETGKLSFSTRLSLGKLYSAVYRGAPTRDRYKFEGVLTRRQLSGTLRHTDDLSPEVGVTTTQLKLQWSGTMTEVMEPPPASYAEWKNSADEILRRLGPKW